MDPITASIVTGLATSYFVEFTAPTVKDFFAKAIALRPQLEDKLQAARTPVDFEAVFREATGVIDAAAGSGSIRVDGAFLTAMRGIRFDHQNGIVAIAGSVVKAQILQTGGSGLGQTTVGGGTSLQSQGTRIDIGHGAAIVISGNASIRQT